MKMGTDVRIFRGKDNLKFTGKIRLMVVQWVWRRKLSMELKDLGRVSILKCNKRTNNFMNEPFIKSNQEINTGWRTEGLEGLRKKNCRNYRLQHSMRSRPV